MSAGSPVHAVEVIGGASARRAGPPVEARARGRRRMIRSFRRYEIRHAHGLKKAPSGGLGAIDIERDRFSSLNSRQKHSIGRLEASSNLMVMLSPSFPRVTSVAGRPKTKRAEGSLGPGWVAPAAGLASRMSPWWSSLFYDAVGISG